MGEFFKNINWKHVLIMCIGNILAGMGIAIFKLAGLGTDPFSGMNMAVAAKLGMAYGNFQLLVNVVLLVVQVAGTGGTFPIEVAPKFFQAVYPLLPFTHSMAALRETVGGMYGMNYWIDLGKLAIFLVISLFVGLVLRKPIIKLNDAFTEKLEETKLM